MSRSACLGLCSQTTTHQLDPFGSACLSVSLPVCPLLLQYLCCEIAALQQTRTLPRQLKVFDVAHMAWRMQTACSMEAAINVYEKVWTVGQRYSSLCFHSLSLLWGATQQQGGGIRAGVFDWSGLFALPTPVVWAVREGASCFVSCKSELIAMDYCIVLYSTVLHCTVTTIL